MKKFKYPLAVNGTPDQLKSLFKAIEALGYYYDSLSDNSPNSLFTCIYPNSSVVLSIAPADKWKIHQTGPLERTILSADNPELVLALAAAVEGNEFHEGEWIYTTSGSCGWGMNSEDEEKLFKVLSVDPLQTSERLVLDRTSNKTTYTKCRLKVRSQDVRKATKEEIINHFNMDNKCCGVSPQEKTYTVKESFVKAAHAQACSEWKQKIEKEFPEMFVSYSRGSKFSRNGQTYILARTGNEEMNLIDLESGNRWGDHISVGNDLEMTREEFNKFYNAESFKPIK
jgi:hypothetical protein